MRNTELINDIEVTLTVQLGEQKISIREFLKLSPGSVVNLSHYVKDPLTFFANGKPLGLCEIVTVNDKFGIRILKMFHNQFN